MKSIKFCDLAMKLFPETKPRSASQRLRRWIGGDGELKRRLAKRGYEKGQRILTKNQAMIIVRWIG